MKNILVEPKKIQKDEEKIEIIDEIKLLANFTFINKNLNFYSHYNEPSYVKFKNFLINMVEATEFKYDTTIFVNLHFHNAQVNLPDWKNRFNEKHMIDSNNREYTIKINLFSVDQKIDINYPSIFMLPIDNKNIKSITNLLKNTYKDSYTAFNKDTGNNLIKINNKFLFLFLKKKIKI